MNMAMRRNSSKLLSRVWRRLLISSWMLLKLDAQHGDSGGFGSGDSGCGVFEGYGVGGTEAEVAEDAEVDFRVGFAFGYAVAGEDEVEVVDGFDMPEGREEVAFA